MGRPRAFDRDVALARAMETFWDKGYESATLDDLCSAMALSRSSLYQAFGDKRRLLLAAIAHYDAVVDAGVVARLRRPGSCRQALNAFLGEIIDQTVEARERRGCFLGNCAAELAGHDDEAAAAVRRGLSRVEAALIEALARGQAAGEIASGENIRALARFFTSTAQGLRLLAKAGAERPLLDDVARIALRCLG